MSSSNVGFVTVTIIITLVLLSTTTTMKTTEAVRFELKSGLVKCVSEEIKSNAMTVGKYSVVNPNEGRPLPDSHKLTVTVSKVASRYGNYYHRGDNVTSGQFAFTTAEAGDYLACFVAAEHNPEEKFSVDFDWRTGIAGKDWINVAKKGSVEALELELKKLEDTITSIQEEMYYLCEREQQVQELNRATDSKMLFLGFLSLLVCSSVAGFQYWHLKSFFQKKKLI